jgi:isocitrate lyase
MGHVGSTDMDLYSSVEIADGARRTISALRKFQFTMAVGDPDAGEPPKHLHSPPLLVDMDGGYGNAFNVARTAELYVNAGVAACHLEDQVLPKRCGHIAGKALISAAETVGKLKAIRDVANDLGNSDFVIIGRTDAVSAVDAPESTRGVDLAIERACRYLDSGVPDLIWCEFPNADRAPTEKFATEVRKRHPSARFAFNWSSSFKWHEDPNRAAACRVRRGSGSADPQSPPVLGCRLPQLDWRRLRCRAAEPEHSRRAPRRADGVGGTTGSPAGQWLGQGARNTPVTS